MDEISRGEIGIKTKCVEAIGGKRKNDFGFDT